MYYQTESPICFKAVHTNKINDYINTSYETFRTESRFMKGISKSQIMRALAFMFIFIFQGITICSACSMYKITKNGKTIVGNNEDWISPNSQFWFVPGENGLHGVMYVGLLDNFAQGAIKDAGLVFDGFANPYLQVKNSAGKKIIPISRAIEHIMQNLSSVTDVKDYLSEINLSALN